ncbi:fatty acid cis/trans isomerase [Chitinibacter sp. SCUT-21]|uniref:fatty acid cis/trans isomerase n=1 Tax=Chitinibacter sp. SCUT-21 TaxID=2970891 RepID=UPI0035A5C8D3
MKLKHACVLILVVWLAACSSIKEAKWDKHYGDAQIQRFDVPVPPKSGEVYYRDVQPILESRCAVCHGCYDAPCQLKLTAWEGIARGANPQPVYDGARLKAVPPTRLFEDAFKSSSWRERGFHSVLNERPAINDIEGSVLAQMLLLKQQNPLPDVSVLPKEFDFSLSRSEQCTTIENFTQYAHQNPLFGMPFGLQGLPPAEHELLLTWIAQGAKREARPSLPAVLTKQIALWEQWLNGDSLKSQLAARYLYEHLFLAHLHFGDDKTFFKLVRSRTKAPQAVDLIATARPYDDPGVARPYYRLVPVQETILSKTHMPYRLDAARMKNWQRWFIDAPYQVTQLPAYDLQTASNPFIVFDQIPVNSRYRMLLDEAKFTVMGFIKGPVCRGNQALNVINDRFWVFFVDPNVIENHDSARFLKENQDALALPDALGSSAPILADWSSYAQSQLRYLQARSQFVQTLVGDGKVDAPKIIWSGDQHNPNAALTVFRHFDSASVEQGLLGERPQTAWVIDYALLERFHYLLVAGFDVYGNVGHQLKSRLYMDFLRIEGEQNLLSLLPDAAHQAIEQQWYRDAPEKTLKYVQASHLPFGPNVSADLAQMSPELAFDRLLARFKQRTAPILNRQFDLSQIQSSKLRQALHNLGAVSGESLQWLPQSVLIKVLPKQGQAIWLTLLNDSAYKNVAQIFFEEKRRLPAEDRLTLLNGFIGAYPNAYWVVPEAQLASLTQQIGALKQESDYTVLMDQFGVRRTSAQFWPLSDEVHHTLRLRQGIDYGLLDYNRLENR